MRFASVLYDGQPHAVAIDGETAIPLTNGGFESTKAGGSAKCLTLRLDGEEAAMWKAS